MRTAPSFRLFLRALVIRTSRPGAPPQFALPGWSFRLSRLSEAQR